MGIVYYLHIGSKENVADCLTKHLTHLPLWSLIKDLLFYHYVEGGVLEVLHMKRTDAPEGECQAGNGIGPEPSVMVLDCWDQIRRLPGLALGTAHWTIRT
jgi:hypothetical protein